MEKKNIEKNMTENKNKFLFFFVLLWLKFQKDFDPSDRKIKLSSQNCK